jgi:Domain of unknown function (DUF3854)
MSDYPTRPGISHATLVAAGIRYSDYPEPRSIEIPYWTEEGELTNFKRWRLPNRADGKKYHQETGTTQYVYHPPGYFHGTDIVVLAIRFGLTIDDIVLPEGEFKTLSLLEAGVWAIGLPSFGVYNRDENGNRQLLRDLQVTFGKEKPGRSFYLGDSDTATNFEFSRNAEFLASAANPAKVFLPRIPFNQPKGIDDCKEKLGAEFDAFFTSLIRDAIELPRKISAPSIALILLEREAAALKALNGVEREKQFQWIVRLCGAAQAYDNSQETIRLCKLAREIIGLNATELKAAIKDRRVKDARERKKENGSSGRDSAKTESKHKPETTTTTEFDDTDDKLPADRNA